MCVLCRSKQNRYQRVRRLIIEKKMSPEDALAFDTKRDALRTRRREIEDELAKRIARLSVSEEAPAKVEKAEEEAEEEAEEAESTYSRDSDSDFEEY